MERVLALDVGEKRIGVAVSDALFITAQGVTTLVRQNWREDVKAIRELIKKCEAKEIVVGIPKGLDGSLGPSALKVQEFIKKMQRFITLPIIEWDERFSTAASERTLIEADVRRDKRKTVIDKMAAQFILQGYMDFKRNTDNS
jgi:putative Holliday junction resolvase